MRHKRAKFLAPELCERSHLVQIALQLGSERDWFAQRHQMPARQFVDLDAQSLTHHAALVLDRTEAVVAPLDEPDRDVRPRLQREILERLLRLLGFWRSGLDHDLGYIVQELELGVERRVRVAPLPNCLLLACRP